MQIERAVHALKTTIGALDLEALAALMTGEISVKALAAAEVTSRQMNPQEVLLDRYDVHGNWIEEAQ